MNLSELTPYRALYEAAGKILPFDRDELRLAPLTGSRVVCRRHWFVSENRDVHPPANYQDSGPTYQALVAYYLNSSPHSGRTFSKELHLADRDVKENREFSYLVFHDERQAESTPPKRATLLLHGLNEKSWHKYIPWAVRLVELTGRPVILFPLAFHINRAPAAWADPREMMGVYRERKRLFATLEAGSFANAALSHRVQFAPHRFMTSSFQSYYDVVDLVRGCVAGRAGGLTAGTTVDLFGYSIGASLATLLLMRNPERLFSSSNAFLFCGGAVLEDARPVSRTIIDDAAYAGLQSYLARVVRKVQLSRPEGADRPTRHSRELRLFRSLIFRDGLHRLRERAMRSVNVRVRALGLPHDAVFPVEGIRRSWRSRSGVPLLRVYEQDPEIPYTHEKPFPAEASDQERLESFFDSVFRLAAHHLADVPLHVRAEPSIV